MRVDRDWGNGQLGGVWGTLRYWRRHVRSQRPLRGPRDRGDQPIAPAAYARNVPGLVRVIAERLAEQIDALVYRLRADNKAGPNLRHPRLVAEHIRRSANQCQEKLERQIGQRNVASGASDALLPDIKVQVANNECARSGFGQVAWHMVHRSEQALFTRR